MRKTIHAEEGHWLTQSDSNKFRPRVFVKSLPVNYPQYWTQWTDEQKNEYEKEHGKQTLLTLLKYANNFDYSKVPGGILGGKVEE